VSGRPRRARLHIEQVEKYERLQGLADVRGLIKRVREPWVRHADAVRDRTARSGTLILVRARVIGAPDNVRGTLSAGGVEWMQAGRGMWHGGGLDKQVGRVASSSGSPYRPALELGPTVSIYLALKIFSATVRRASCSATTGSRRARSPVPSLINYLAVRLKAGERWR